ncbi:MAG: hypothetical protein IT368_09470, partial [Candidatus Hydrogenedentes bacterium]|nr:hypothetical protein [Candidatus Hydrogenedentota bacterium]
MAEFNGAGPEFERLQAELHAEREARAAAEDRVRRLEARLEELTNLATAGAAPASASSPEPPAPASALGLLELAAAAPGAAGAEDHAELELWLVQAQLVAEALETAPEMVPGAFFQMQALATPQPIADTQVPEALKSARLAVEAAEARAAHNAQQVKKLTEELAEARAEQMRTASRLRELTQRLDRMEQAPQEQAEASAVAPTPVQQDLSLELPAPPWAPELLEDEVAPEPAIETDVISAAAFEPIPALEEAHAVEVRAPAADSDEAIAAALEEWQAEAELEPTAPHETEWAMDAPEPAESDMEPHEEIPAEEEKTDLDLAGALEAWGAESDDSIAVTVDDLTSALENADGETEAAEAQATEVGLSIDGRSLAFAEADSDGPGVEAERESDDALARAWADFGVDVQEAPAAEQAQEAAADVSIDFGGIDISLDEPAMPEPHAEAEASAPEELRETPADQDAEEGLGRDDRDAHLGQAMAPSRDQSLQPEDAANPDRQDTTEEEEEFDFDVLDARMTQAVEEEFDAPADVPVDTPVTQAAPEPEDEFDFDALDARMTQAIDEELSRPTIVPEAYDIPEPDTGAALGDEDIAEEHTVDSDVDEVAEPAAPAPHEAWPSDSNVETPPEPAPAAPEPAIEAIPEPTPAG